MELDHLYRETVDWEASVAFWERLGFTFLEQWGSQPHRAGRLTSGEASVVLAETDSRAPSHSVFVNVDDLDAVAVRTGVAAVDTHWGTRMVSLNDPDGRTYNFEPRSDES